MAKAWSSLAELLGFLLPARAEKLSSTAAAMRQAEMMEMLRQFGAGLRSFLLSIISPTKLRRGKLELGIEFPQHILHLKMFFRDLRYKNNVIENLEMMQLCTGH